MKEFRQPTQLSFWVDGYSVESERENDLLGVLFPQLTATCGCRWARFIYFFASPTAVIREENVFTIRRRRLCCRAAAAAEPGGASASAVVCTACSFRLLALSSGSTLDPHASPLGVCCFCCFSPLITSQDLFFYPHKHDYNTHMCDVMLGKKIVSPQFPLAYLPVWQLNLSSL